MHAMDEIIQEGEVFFAGHTQSWEPGQPGFLTKCSGSSLPEFGPVNPIADSVYGFLQKFFAEITTVFPDSLLHLGGDEVDPRCWYVDIHLHVFLI